MPENDCDSEGTPLDAKDWKIAFAPYAGNPGAALTLACHFVVLKSFLRDEPLKLQEAIEALDRAVEGLFPHTEFQEVSEDLFHKLIEGRITFEEDQMLKALGIKF